MIAPCAGHPSRHGPARPSPRPRSAAALVLRGIDDDAPSAFAALGFAAFSIPALVAGVAIARKRPANPVGPIVAGLWA